MKYWTALTTSEQLEILNKIEELNDFGMSFEEIAKEVDLSVNRVASIYARRHMYKRFLEHEFSKG